LKIIDVTVTSDEGLGVECEPESNGSGRVSIVKIRYQETSSENIEEE
jgi:hypothetical protein